VGGSRRREKILQKIVYTADSTRHRLGVGRRTADSVAFGPLIGRLPSGHSPSRRLRTGQARTRRRGLAAPPGVAGEQSGGAGTATTSLRFRESSMLYDLARGPQPPDGRCGGSRSSSRANVRSSGPPATQSFAIPVHRGSAGSAVRSVRQSSLSGSARRCPRL